MKALPTNSNYDKLRENIAERILYLNTKSLVFIDTNILTWIYRLNEDSFNEFSQLLLSLVNRDELIIPNWVVHEYNNLLMSNSEEIFFPYKRRLKSFSKELEYLNEIGRLAIDNELTQKNGYVNKREFIKEMTIEIGSLRKKLNLITDKNNIKHQKRRKFIEELILKTQSSVSVAKITELTSQFQFRLENKIPPGFMDKNKDSNKYGDVIIWHEIIENCKIRNINKALFLSSDVKKDWVYSPDKIILNGKETYNNSKTKYYFLHPWLQEEFESKINDGEIAFANIPEIVEILYSPDLNPIAFEEFKSLAKTIDIELKNSETNKVIEWLIINGRQLHYLRTELCNYDNDPGEVDFNKFKKWCTENIKADIDFNQVKWIDVFMNLFL